MVTLNLSAANTGQRVIKEYLEENASAALADKINNGARITKDGKTLLNKKSLETFMTYACDEAQKQSDKGARAACVEQSTVFNWAIHYFEEDTIEGKLYNDDGTEYKMSKPVVATKSTVKVSVPPAKPKQDTFFDMMDSEPETSEPIDEPEPDDEPTEEIEPEPVVSADDDEPTKISEMKFIDKYGEIHTVIPDALKEIFGNLLIPGVEV